MKDEAEAKADQWAILEMMGHTRTAGRVSEEMHFGAMMGRMDVPKNDGADGYNTFFFAGASVFRMTPCTEAVARAVAKGNQPHPVSPYEMPAAQRALAYRDEDDEDDSQ